MGIKKDIILPIKWRLTKWRKAREWSHPDGEDMQNLIKEEEEAYHRSKRANSIREENYHKGRLDILKELWEKTEEEESTETSTQ